MTGFYVHLKVYCDQCGCCLTVKDRGESLVHDVNGACPRNGKRYKSIKVQLEPADTPARP